MRLAPMMALPCLLGVLGLLGVTLGSCDGAPADETSGDLGLMPMAQVSIADGHVTEVVVFGDHVYAADHGGLGLVVLRLGAGGELTRVDDPLPAGETMGAYTTLAVHEPSGTLFAGSFTGAVHAYDLTDPDHPARVPAPPAVSELAVRDLEVAGDRLLLAAFEAGLWSAPIGNDGALGEAARLLDDRVAFAAPVEGELAALTLDGRLLLGGPGDWQTLDIEGPALGLATEGRRIAVARGSEGVLVLERVSDPGSETGVVPLATITPPAVVADVALAGDRVVALALNGVYAYELVGAGDPTSNARLFGFHPSGPWREGTAAHFLAGTLAGDLLIASEWVHVTSFRLRPEGGVLALDHPRGLYLAAGEELRIPVRNVASQPIQLRVRLLGQTIDERAIPGGATLTITPPAGGWPVDLQGHPSVLVEMEQSDLEGGLYRSDLQVLFREPETPPVVRPAPGHPFPPIATRRADAVDALWAVPEAGVPTRVVFYSMGCAAMWPEMLDASWLSARGELDGGAALALVSPDDESWNGYETRWGLNPTEGHFYLEAAPSELLDRNAAFGSGDFYFESFHLRLPGDAHPTDYLVDAEGIVRAVERMYRGRHPLRL